MIRSLSEMSSLVRSLLADVETEVVEYKEAKRNFDFEKLGKYFSALSNEANLRNAECGWLLFGVTNKREICGTAYRKEERTPSVGLRSLKHEITESLNNGLTFEEVYEFDMDGKRVVAFQIPPCEFASPTTWRGVPWSRENESLKEMPRFKLEAIWGQSRPDWSKRVSFEASLDDLDPEAVKFACERYVDKYAEKQPAIRSLSEEEMLRKMGLLIHRFGLGRCYRGCSTAHARKTPSPRRRKRTRTTQGAPIEAPRRASEGRERNEALPSSTHPREVHAASSAMSPAPSHAACHESNSKETPVCPSALTPLGNVWKTSNLLRFPDPLCVGKRQAKE